MKISTKSLFELLVLTTIILTLTLAGCGGGGSGNGSGSTNSMPLTASGFAKIAAGDTWTWSGVVTTVTSGSTSTTTQSETKTIISNQNGIASESDVTYVSGVAVISGMLTRQIDPATGSLIDTTNLTGQQRTLFPANFGVGTSWTWMAASGVNAALIATVTAINVTRTVPAGSFNDCIQVNIASFVVGTQTESDIYYMSPSVGVAVETQNSLSAPGISISGNSLLQPGYVAH